MFRSSPFETAGPITDFDSIKIQLASPEKIRSWSHTRKVQCSMNPIMN